MTLVFGGGVRYSVALRVFTAFYASVLIVATHWPGLRIAAGINAGIPADKLLHCLSYSGLGVCLGLLAVLSKGRRRPAIFKGIVLLCMFAAVDELTQPWFGRSCDPVDWIADVFGGVVGLLAVCLLPRLRPLGISVFSAKT